MRKTTDKECNKEMKLLIYLLFWLSDDICFICIVISTRFLFILLLFLFFSNQGTRYFL